MDFIVLYGLIDIIDFYNSFENLSALKQYKLPEVHPLK